MIDKNKAAPEAAREDRERRIRLEDLQKLVGKFKQMQRYYYKPCDLAHSDEEASPTWANVSQAYRDCADDIIAILRAPVPAERAGDALCEWCHGNKCPGLVCQYCHGTGKQRADAEGA